MKDSLPLYCFVTVLFLGSLLAGGPGAQEEYGDLPSNLEWVEQLAIDWTPRAGHPHREDLSQDSLSVRFSAWGRDFDMRLRPARLFAEKARNIWVHEEGRLVRETPEALFLSGSLSDDPRSQVRLSLIGDDIEGLLLSGDEAYVLEPARRHFSGAGPGPMVAYRLNDMEAGWPASQCGLQLESRSPSWQDQPLEDQPAPPETALKSLLDEIRLLESGEVRQVDIRLVADSYYYQRYGSATASRLQSIIHQVNAIYERETGLSLRISETRVWTSRSQDGVSGTTDADDLIDEFSTAEHVAGNDLAHLFTGRQLAGPVGIARIGGICNTVHATSISQDLSNTAQRIILAAHEIGHNLGARHDGTGSCQEASSGFIMWPVVDASANGFSECSLGSIARRLERAQCIAPDGPPLPAPQTLGPGGTLMESSPLFHWQPVEGSQSYRLEIYNQSSAESILDQRVGEEHFRPQEPLARRHHYRWRINAADSGGEGEWSAWQEFQILPLDAPVPVAPLGTVASPQPRFSWEASPGAVSYLLEIVNDETDEYTAEGTSDLEFTPPAGLDGSRFRWRISALDEQGAPSTSEWRRFVIRSPRGSLPPRIRP